MVTIQAVRVLAARWLNNFLHLFSASVDSISLCSLGANGGAEMGVELELGGLTHTRAPSSKANATTGQWSRSKALVVWVFFPG